MMTKQHARRICLAAAVAFATAGLGAPSFAQQQQQSPNSSQSSKAVVTEQGFTQPSERADLAMQNWGIIREVPFKEHAQVKKGDVLLVQDERIEAELLKQLELDANSDLRIVAAEKNLAQKKIELARRQQIFAQGAGAESEVEAAQLEVDFRTAEFGIAKIEQATAKSKAEQQRVKVELMKLISPFDGVIDTIEANVGEVTDPQKPVISVVQINPLKIELHLPTAQAAKLKQGDTLEVRYENDGEAAAWVPATVKSLAPVAAADANRRKVYLELPNPDLREAGLWVSVKVPDRLLDGSPAGAALPAAANATPAEPSN